MNGFVTSLESVADCAISTPLVRVPARHVGVIMAQISIEKGQKLSVRYMGIHFAKFLRIGGISKLNTALPTVYAAVYHGNFEKFGSPTGRPVGYIGLDYPGYASMDPATPFEFRLPGVYSFALVNNAASNDIAALVTGAARVTDPR